MQRHRRGAMTDHAETGVGHARAADEDLGPGPALAVRLPATPARSARRQAGGRDAGQRAARVRQDPARGLGASRAGAAATAWVNLDIGDNDVERLCAAIAAALALRRGAADSPVLADDIPGGVRTAVPDRPGRRSRRAVRSDPVGSRRCSGDRRQGRPAHPAAHPQAPACGRSARAPVRVDPPLALVRLRLEGRLAELRAEHLRSRARDCRAARPERPDPPPDQIGMLHDEPTACGPAAGGVVAERRRDPDQFLDEFSGDERSVADYLVDEVLRTMPADTRELLGLVSVCDPIPAELAVELEAVDAARARRTPRLGADHSWPTAVGPRVHVLLRSYLRAELARQRPP